MPSCPSPVWENTQGQQGTKTLDVSSFGATPDTAQAQPRHAITTPYVMPPEGTGELSGNAAKLRASALRSTPRRLGVLGAPRRLAAPPPQTIHNFAKRLEAAAPMPHHGRDEPFTLQLPHQDPFQPRPQGGVTTSRLQPTGAVSCAEVESVTRDFGDRLQLGASPPEAPSPQSNGSGQLIGAEHRHMMTPQPLAGLGAAFRTTAEIPATAGRSPQPDEQQSDIHEAAECLGAWTPFARSATSAGSLDESGSAALSPASAFDVPCEPSRMQGVMRDGPCQLSPDANVSLQSSWRAEAKRKTSTPGGTAGHLYLGNPQRLYTTPRQPYAELSRLKTDFVSAGAEPLGTRSILTPVRGRRPTGSNTNTQVAMMVKRSYRNIKEDPDSEKVLQETQYRYAPTDRRLSKEFDSPQDQKATVSLRTNPLSALELPVQQQSPGSTVEITGLFGHSAKRESISPSDDGVTATPRPPAPKSSKKVTKAQLQMSRSKSLSLSPTEERIRKELTAKARSAARAVRRMTNKVQ